eukprot:COSAG04_NODE_4303_length_2171_cov_1.612934_2_plen_164_part_00
MQRLLAPMDPKDDDEKEAGVKLPPQGLDGVDEAYGWTALMWAARSGYKRHVEALLAKGADASVRSSGEYWLNGRRFPEGSTALDIAKIAGRPAANALALLQEEAGMGAVDDDDPLEWSARPMTPGMSGRGGLDDLLHGASDGEDQLRFEAHLAWRPRCFVTAS